MHVFCVSNFHILSISAMLQASSTKYKLHIEYKYKLHMLYEIVYFYRYFFCHFYHKLVGPELDIMPPTVGYRVISIAFVHPSVCLSVSVAYVVNAKACRAQIWIDGCPP